MGKRAKGIFFYHARDFPSGIVEAGWPSGKDARFVVWWSWKQALHPATNWIVIQWFLEFSSLAVLCIWPTAACLQPVEVFTPHVYLQCLGPDCSYWS